MAIVAKSARSVEPVVPAALVTRPDINPRLRARTSSSEQPVATVAAEPHARPDDYVGYKHPPKSGQFKKGKSGNPKGRPKNAKGMKTIARQVLTEKVSVRTASGVKRMTKMEALIHKNTELAFAGNLRALLACGSLYQNAVPDEVPHAAAAAAASPLTDTGRAILDMFADEIRQEDRDKGNSP